MSKADQIELEGQFETDLACYFRAMLPCLFLQTSEESRYFSRLIRVIQHLGLAKQGLRQVIVWSAVETRKLNPFSASQERVQSETQGQQEFYQVLSDFAQLSGGKHTDSILVLLDATDQLTGSSAALHTRRLRETLAAIRGQRKTVVLIGLPFAIPREIEASVTCIPCPLPNTQELTAVTGTLLKAYAEAYKGVAVQHEVVPAFCRASSGVTEEETRALIALALAKHGNFDTRAVTLALSEKERIVRRSNVLECETPAGGFEDVGGLVNLKNWLNEITPILEKPEAAKAYGVKLPTGMLLAGIPGTGKSLCARKLAAHWKLPLLTFDMGRAFGSFVGQSEGNIREMIRIAEAMRPTVLLFDEIEKALAPGGAGDSGTTSRVTATLLTWLGTDKPDDIFCVATANDLTRLNAMPELVRRFGDTFFCDLLDLRARIEVLAIHLKIAGHQVGPDNLVEIAKACRGFTGDECARLVQRALAMAFKDHVPEPTLGMFLRAAAGIRPLKDTMRESINALRAWARDGRAIFAGEPLEDDDRSDLKSFVDCGLPPLPEIR